MFWTIVGIWAILGLTTYLLLVFRGVLREVLEDPEVLDAVSVILPPLVTIKEFKITYMSCILFFNLLAGPISVFTLFRSTEEIKGSLKESILEGTRGYK